MHYPRLYGGGLFQIFARTVEVILINSLLLPQAAAGEARTAELRVHSLAAGHR